MADVNDSIVNPKEAWVVVEHSDVYGDVFLWDYAAAFESQVWDKVWRLAIRNGKKYDVEAKMKQLNWRVVKIQYVYQDAEIK